MKVLLFEFVCGGGCFSFPDLGEPSGSLLSEGMAMLQALYDEFSGAAGIQIKIPLDHRCPDHLNDSLGPGIDIIHSKAELQDYLERMAVDCDRVFIVAPEIQNALLFFTSLLQRQGNLLTPNCEVVAIGSDKYATNTFLTEHGIPTPKTILVGQATSSELRSRTVIKPRWGAGSWGLRRLEAGTSVHSSKIREYLLQFGLRPDEAVIQEYVSGTAASIAVWRTLQGTNCFPAMHQELCPDSWVYRGCKGPLSIDLQQRANNLLQPVIENLPHFYGYLGIDLVLGVDSESDYVIEVNPRLTTSFCVTRKLVDMTFVSQILG